MPDSQPVPVVCALIECNGRVLIAQRPPHKHLGLAWEFPGGKVEPNETPEHALRREIREELGCQVELIRPLPTKLHTYATTTIELIAFVARLAPESKEPKATEHISIQWVEPEKLRTFALAPADIPVVEDYLASLPIP